MPPLNSLRVFEAAARHLSFKKAADELHVTPAAISHQITQLEEFLGVPLFKRMHRGVALTPAASESLRLLTKGFEAIRLAVGHLRIAPTPPLTVSCPPSFAHRWLLPRLHDFFSEHPDLDIQVTTQLDVIQNGIMRSLNSATRLADLVEAYDIVIAFGREDQGPVQSIHLLPLTVAPMCSPALIEGRALDGPDVLSGLPILHDGRGPLYNQPDFWSLWLQQGGLDDAIAQGGQRFTHSFLALDAAANGRGIVVSTPTLAREDLRSGRLILPFERQAPIAQTYHILSGEMRSAEVNVFIDWLRSTAAAETAS